ncbi:MAG: envelope stress response membrane protein PspB [Sandaracinobacteroides sp.]
MIPLTAILGVFVGMPWLILHYVTKWKQAKSITVQDEDLLDELHDIARRLADRMETVERIIAADRPDLPRPSELRSEISNIELHPQLLRKDQAR